MVWRSPHCTPSLGRSGNPYKAGCNPYREAPAPSRICAKDAELIPDLFVRGSGIKAADEPRVFGKVFPLRCILLHRGREKAYFMTRMMLMWMFGVPLIVMLFFVL